MKNCLIALALLGLGSGCAMETELTEDEAGTVQQQIVTQIEKDRIDAKRTANSWLGAAADTNPATAYMESTAGVVRQYWSGAVLYNRSRTTAYVADWDAYFGWSWIGGPQFGYPIGDQRVMATNSSTRVTPFSSGFIVSTPADHDNWPIMKVVNPNYSNGGARITCSYANTQNQLGLTCNGSGFPPNTTVRTGYSGRRTSLGHAVSRTSGADGRFTVSLRPGNGSRVDAYNGIVTVFARAVTGHATFFSQDFSAYPGFLMETSSAY